jgi:hypothetical protein
MSVRLQVRMSDARLRDNGFVTDSSHVPVEDSVSPRVEAVTWKASAYEVDSRAVRAAEDARWDRYEPFARYRPATGGRDALAGPHIPFIGLKESLRKGLVRDWFGFLRDLYSFGNEFGLLGLFWDKYPSGPVLPFEKEFVAPEAVVDARHGRLRLLDPATEGKELLIKLQDRMDKEYDTGGYIERLRRSHQAAGTDPVALPSEAVVFPKVYGNLPSDGSDYRPLPWDEAKQEYGALLVADGRSFTGVSVLCRSEPIHRWMWCLKMFPSPSGERAEQITTGPEGEKRPLDSSDEYLQVVSGMRMQGAVSPYPMVDEEGVLEQGWWCRNQLSALYLMVYLDKTADTDYRRCQAPRCGRLFRAGPNSTRVYCPHPEDPSKQSRCGQRDTTRRAREKRLKA